MWGSRMSEVVWGSRMPRGRGGRGCPRGRGGRGCRRARGGRGRWIWHFAGIPHCIEGVVRLLLRSPRGAQLRAGSGDRGVVGRADRADLAPGCSQDHLRLGQSRPSARYRRVGNDPVQRRLLRGEVGPLLLEDLSGRICVDLGQHLTGYDVITDLDFQRGQSTTLGKSQVFACSGRHRAARVDLVGNRRARDRRCACDRWPSARACCEDEQHEHGIYRRCPASTPHASPVAPADDDDLSTDEHHASGCLRRPQDDQDPRAMGISGGQLIGKTKFEQRHCSRGFRLTGCSLTIHSK